MRTLTAPTIAAATKDASSPYCLLRITFPSPVGVKWYAQEDFGAGDGSSWDNAQGRVLEWGTVRVEMKADKSVNTVSDCTIKLRDEDKALWNIFQQIEPQRSFVTIYTQFRGHGAGDLVKVHAGIVNAPCTWSEKDHAVSLDVTDISTYFNHTIGNLCDRLTFPNVVQTDENKMVPLVFGHVKRAKAVAPNFGPVTSLARQIGYYDMMCYVVDAERFPQNTPMQIFVGGERLNGKFNGNSFSISSRGGAVYTGTVTALGADPQHIVDTALTGGDGAWVGYYLQVTTPDGNTQRKFIRGYDSSTHTLIYGMMSCSPLVQGDPPETTWIGDMILQSSGAPYYTSSAYTLPIGATYQIVTPQMTHPNGARVYVARSSYVYVINDAPSSKVYYLEGWGNPIWNITSTFTYVPAAMEYYCLMNPTLYTINRNDTITCPGRAVTSVAFKFPPSYLDIRLKNDDLYATLDGVETAGDGTGTLLENPSDIIHMIHSRFMGMPSGNLDPVSFANAKTMTALLKMGFSLEKQMNGMELCADLAFQARCSEVCWGGLVRLIYLTNVITALGSPPTEGRDRYLGSLDVARREWNQIVTEVIGSYVNNRVTETIILRSPAAEAFVGGRKSKTIDFWAYADNAPVQGVAQFWLNRWQYIWQQIALVDSLRRLDAEPYDIFDLDLPAWFGLDQVARVIGIEHTLGGGADRKTPGIRLSAEIPYFPDGPCDTLAEAMPASACWSCETSCQLGCELFCTTAAMLESKQTGSTEAGTTPHQTPPHTPPPTAEHTSGPTSYHSAPHTAPHTTQPPPTTVTLVVGGITGGSSAFNGTFHATLVGAYKTAVIPVSAGYISIGFDSAMRRYNVSLFTGLPYEYLMALLSNNAIQGSYGLIYGTGNFAATTVTVSEP